MEAAEALPLGGLDSYQYFYYILEAEAEAETPEAALFPAASTSLSNTKYLFFYVNNWTWIKVSSRHSICFLKRLQIDKMAKRG